ncbi:hypothetical protein HDU82_003880, partial [Entophlyctis luteolus]
MRKDRIVVRHRENAPAASRMRKKKPASKRASLATTASAASRIQSSLPVITDFSGEEYTELLGRLRIHLAPTQLSAFSAAARKYIESHVGASKFAQFCCILKSSPSVPSTSNAEHEGKIDGVPTMLSDLMSPEPESDI